MYLSNPTNTLAVINKHEFAFQKKYGQNFLIDEGIVEKIVREAGVTKDDFVLEIGPGIGTMTQLLCEHAREVAAVEIDDKLITANGPKAAMEFALAICEALELEPKF